MPRRDRTHGINIYLLPWWHIDHRCTAVQVSPQTEWCSGESWSSPSRLLWVPHRNQKVAWNLLTTLSIWLRSWNSPTHMQENTCSGAPYTRRNIMTTEQNTRNSHFRQDKQSGCTTQLSRRVFVENWQALGKAHMWYWKEWMMLTSKWRKAFAQNHL